MPHIQITTTASGGLHQMFSKACTEGLEVLAQAGGLGSLATRQRYNSGSSGKLETPVQQTGVFQGKGQITWKGSAEESSNSSTPNSRSSLPSRDV